MINETKAELSSENAFRYFGYSVFGQPAPIQKAFHSEASGSFIPSYFPLNFIPATLHPIQI